MNPLLAHQVEEAITPRQPSRRAAQGCQASLRVAAAMLSHAQSDLVTATTVVGALGQDDVDALSALVAAIAQEFGLESSLRIHAGSFSVRFSRRIRKGS